MNPPPPLSAMPPHPPPPRPPPPPVGRTPTSAPPRPANPPSLGAPSPSGSGSPPPPQSPSSSSPGSPTSPLPPLKRPHSVATDTTASTLPSDESTGRRRRKKTKTRVFEIPHGPTVARRLSTGARGVLGRGAKLATIPNVQYAVDKCAAKDPQIEFLHRLLFNSAGQAFRRKATIRAFSGFVFRSEKERGRVRHKLLRAHANMVKKVAYLLDVDHRDSKEATADAIMLFLEEPKLLDGRGNRAERERQQKAERRKAEKARAKKRKEEERKKLRKGLENASDTDEDGDEDLEFEAKTWIVMARENEAARLNSCDEQEFEEETESPDEAEQPSDDESDGGEEDSDEERLSDVRTWQEDDDLRRRAEEMLLCVDETILDEGHA